jgi:surfeit locus 1 family protein
MSARIPIVSTLVVLAAAAIMVALGIWQLGRAEEKEALLARYAQAQTMSSEAVWPADPAEYDSALYRHSSLDCRAATPLNPVAGRSASEESGWAHRAACVLPGGAEAEIALGWSRDPAPVEWTGGEVTGTIGPAGETIRLVASPPQAGLEELAPPDPANVPNNHLSYAVQWFLFAVTALVIYVLALRQRRLGGTR